MKLPMNPLGALIVAVANAWGMFLVLELLFNGTDAGSAVAGLIVGMLTFGILIVEDKTDL